MYPLLGVHTVFPSAKPRADRGRRGRGRGRPGAKGRGRGRGVAPFAPIADEIHEGDAGVDTEAHVADEPADASGRADPIDDSEENAEHQDVIDAEAELLEQEMVLLHFLGRSFPFLFFFLLVSDSPFFFWSIT